VLTTANAAGTNNLMIVVSYDDEEGCLKKRREDLTLEICNLAAMGLPVTSAAFYILVNCGHLGMLLFLKSLSTL
jgi:hypothetical protein